MCVSVLIHVCYTEYCAVHLNRHYEFVDNKVEKYFKTWFSNPWSAGRMHPARLCCAARDNICKLCTYYKDYTCYGLDGSEIQTR